MICEKMRRYEPPTVVQCPYCKQRIFVSNPGLLYYSCSKCGRVFTSFGNLL
nr:TFIIB-type zinc ribbon-containing protein [Candidatus Prometheoarchaeum syntrophicum]